MNLLILLTIHHIIDTTQPQWLLDYKKKYVWAHYEHAFAQAGALSIALYLLGIFEWWHFPFFLLGHGFIDYFFYIVLPKYTEKKYGYVWIDQALHYLQILIIL